MIKLLNTGMKMGRIGNIYPELPVRDLMQARQEHVRKRAHLVRVCLAVDPLTCRLVLNWGFILVRVPPAVGLGVPVGRLSLFFLHPCIRLEDIKCL